MIGREDLNWNTMPPRDLALWVLPISDFGFNLNANRDDICNVQNVSENDVKVQRWYFLEC